MENFQMFLCCSMPLVIDIFESVKHYLLLAFSFWEKFDGYCQVSVLLGPYLLK